MSMKIKDFGAGKFMINEIYRRIIEILGNQVIK